MNSGTIGWQPQHKNKQKGKEKNHKKCFCCFRYVDVFGTIRSRTEFHLYNAESLKSQTKIEYFAIDKNTREVIVQPTVSAFESQYKENYLFWSGPFKTVKTIKAAEPLLVDFSDISPSSNLSGSLNNSDDKFNSHTSEMPSDEIIRNRRR